jgi:hypothetical protein
VERDGLESIGNEVASDVMLPEGTPIDDETVAHVRQAVAEETVAVRWRTGELLIDKRIALHGRRHYRGARE